MAKRRCNLCNRAVGWWRGLLVGACEHCCYRTSHGGSPLRWQDDPAASPPLTTKTEES